MVFLFYPFAADAILEAVEASDLVVYHRWNPHKRYAESKEKMKVVNKACWTKLSGVLTPGVGKNWNNTRTYLPGRIGGSCRSGTLYMNLPFKHQNWTINNWYRWNP